MRFRQLLFVVLLGALAGCATTGGTSEDKAPEVVEAPVSAAAAEVAAKLGVATVPADKALLYLYRPKRYVGSANTYQITIDGTPAADMKVGTRLSYPLAPGRVTLQGRALPNILNVGLAMGMMEKPNIAFDVEAGKVYFIDVKTGFAGGPQFEFVDSATAIKAARDLKPAEPPEAAPKQ